MKSSGGPTAATTARRLRWTELRRWYRREMLRIQTASVCHSQPIFDTLARTSDLADAVIARAYEIAIAGDVRQRILPPTGDYRPVDQLWVIALGRLGMREFDLASDADLVFVLAGYATPQECVLDTRRRALRRPDHRLHRRRSAVRGRYAVYAPTASTGRWCKPKPPFKDYFSRAAEAWEGITYMKSRAVAGDRRAPNYSCMNSRKSIGALRTERALAHGS